MQVYKAICQKCGKEFESFVNPKNANKRKYCSRECGANAQWERYREKHNRSKGDRILNFKGICSECGKSFEKYLSYSAQDKGKGIFCSVFCKNKAYWKTRKLTDADKTKICEYCGKDFVYTGNHKSQRFCSLKCANLKTAADKQKNDRTLVCKHCGKEFVRNLTDKELAKGKGKYCSRECHDKHIAWTQLYCQQCGKPLRRKSGDKYCSKKCAGLGRRLENGHINPQGYVLLTIEDGRRILQHRYVMEQMLGRELYDFEKVHHIDGKRSNNEPANLEIWLNGHPGGQRLQDIYKKDVERLAFENYNLKQQLNSQSKGDKNGIRNIR